MHVEPLDKGAPPLGPTSRLGRYRESDEADAPPRGNPGSVPAPRRLHFPALCGRGRRRQKKAGPPGAEKVRFSVQRSGPPFTPLRADGSPRRLAQLLPRFFLRTR